MAELKTKENDASVKGFINKVEDINKRKETFVLLEMFKEITKEKPRMWGSAIIGFGKYHYKSESSKREGDWFMTGFSPRKQALTIYIISGLKKHEELLKKLGKYKSTAGSCLYIKSLDDIDIKVLRKLVQESFNQLKKKHSA